MALVVSNSAQIIPLSYKSSYFDDEFVRAHGVPCRFEKRDQRIFALPRTQEQTDSFITTFRTQERALEGISCPRKAQTGDLGLVAYCNGACMSAVTFSPHSKETAQRTCLEAIKKLGGTIASPDNDDWRKIGDNASWVVAGTGNRMGYYYAGFMTRESHAEFEAFIAATNRESLSAIAYSSISFDEVSQALERCSQAVSKQNGPGLISVLRHALLPQWITK